MVLPFHTQQATATGALAAGTHTHASFPSPTQLNPATVAANASPLTLTRAHMHIAPSHAPMHTRNTGERAMWPV
jgi:hypothetical protein